MINHISICFLPQYQRQGKRLFFRARAKKVIARHIDANSVDSYQQWQISQIVVKFNIHMFRYFYNHLSNYSIPFSPMDLPLIVSACLSYGKSDFAEAISDCTRQRCQAVLLRRRGEEGG